MMRMCTTERDLMCANFSVCIHIRICARYLHVRICAWVLTRSARLPVWKLLRLDHFCGAQQGNCQRHSIARSQSDFQANDGGLGEQKGFRGCGFASPRILRSTVIVSCCVNTQSLTPTHATRTNRKSGARKSCIACRASCTHVRTHIHVP